MKEPKQAGVSMWELYKKGGLTPAITSMFNVRNAQQMAFIRSIAKEQRKNSLYDIRLDRMEAVVFDLETTGFSPYNGDEIISAGAVAVRGREVLEAETFYSTVNPKRDIPVHIEELTGLTSRAAGHAPELIDVLREFLEFAGNRVLIAHASGHDKRFLNAALWKTSRTKLNHRMLDTMMMAKWLHPKKDRYCLDSQLEQYRIPVIHRHHALEDSRMTAHLWSRQLEEIEGRDILTLGDLYTHLSRY